ncbi:MAG TPA: aldo/keto reductase [Myxococcaceae bacterium]|nr:aldo/keto reductase [Myxococcaceae bacterium]
MPVIPRVVVGAARLGFVLPDPLARRSWQDREMRTLDSLVEAGCTAFDLAASYQLGGTERLFGRWMASRGVRNRLLLIGKGGHPYLGLRPNRLTPGALSADLHASLRRLGIEQVDLYLLHRDAPGAPLEPIVRMLGAAYREGKIRAWGVSNWSVDRIEGIQAAAQQEGLPPIAASSPHFSLVDWVRPPWTGSVSIAGPAGRPGRAFHTRTQLPVLAWSPLGSGFLTSEEAGGYYASAANVARRERARAMAHARGWSVAQVALAYLFSQPFPVSAVVAASTAAKMRENLAAAELRLTAPEVQALEG